MLRPSPAACPARRQTGLDTEPSPSLKPRTGRVTASCGSSLGQGAETVRSASLSLRSRRTYFDLGPFSRARRAHHRGDKGVPLNVLLHAPEGLARHPLASPRSSASSGSVSPDKNFVHVAATDRPEARRFPCGPLAHYSCAARGQVGRGHVVLRRPQRLRGDLGGTELAVGLEETREQDGDGIDRESVSVAELRQLRPREVGVRRDVVEIERTVASLTTRFTSSRASARATTPAAGRARGAGTRPSGA